MNSEVDLDLGLGLGSSNKENCLSKRWFGYGAFSDAEKYQIYKFEKVDTEELDDLNETGLEEKLKEGNKYYSVDDEWMLELIDPPITRLPAKD